MGTVEAGTLLTTLSVPNGLSPEISLMAQSLVNSYADNQEAEILLGRGHDSRPIPGDTVYMLPVFDDAGNKIAFVVHAELIPDTNMLPGDNDLHSNIGGIKVSQVKCSSTGLIVIKNQVTNLLAELTGYIDELSTLIDHISALTTFGSPGSHALTPDVIANLTADKAALVARKVTLSTLLGSV